MSIDKEIKVKFDQGDYFYVISSNSETQTISLSYKDVRFYEVIEITLDDLDALVKILQEVGDFIKN